MAHFLPYLDYHQGKHITDYTTRYTNKMHRERALYYNERMKKKKKNGRKKNVTTNRAIMCVRLRIITQFISENGRMLPI